MNAIPSTGEVQFRERVSLEVVAGACDSSLPKSQLPVSGVSWGCFTGDVPVPSGPPHPTNNADACDETVCSSGAPTLAEQRAALAVFQVSDLHHVPWGPRVHRWAECQDQAGR